MSFYLFIYFFLPSRWGEIKLEFHVGETLADNYLDLRRRRWNWEREVCTSQSVKSCSKSPALWSCTGRAATLIPWTRFLLPLLLLLLLYGVPVNNKWAELARLRAFVIIEGNLPLSSLSTLPTSLDHLNPILASSPLARFLLFNGFV